MGCCQSDLKGDQPGDITGESTQPIKKVQTNFSTVDYDAGGTGRRDTVVAPHEAERQKSDVLSPLTERAENPLTNQGSIDGTTAAESTQRDTAGADRLGFENKLTEHSEKPKLSTENTEHKPPYHDATASPTVEQQAKTLDDAVAPSQPHPVDSTISEKPTQ